MKIITFILILIWSNIYATKPDNNMGQILNEEYQTFGIPFIPHKNMEYSQLANHHLDFEQAFSDSVNGTYWPNAYYGSTTELSADFGDLDSDGDLDLVQGSLRRLEMIMNIGNSSNPEWESLTYGNIINESNRWVPELVDIDGDNDLDLFCGIYSGSIVFFENIGSEFEPYWSEPIYNYSEILVGNWARPVFCDIDSDDDYDLFIGTKNYDLKAGLIYYYENVGTDSVPSFQYRDSSYVETYSSDSVSPEFVDIDSDNDFDLLIGKEWGQIILYRNVGDSAEPIWSYESGQYGNIYLGWTHLQPNFVDIDDDDDKDMFLTDLKGYFHHYENIGNKYEPLWNFSSIFFSRTLNFGRSSGPGSGDIDNDGDNDIVFGNSTILENTGSPSNPQWKIEDLPGNNVEYLFDMTTLVDIDGDNDLDLFYGDNGGYISYYENSGTPSVPNWILISSFYEDIAYGSNTHVSVSFADIDGDLDYDMFVQHCNWNNSNYPSGYDLVSFYENIGNATEPLWALINENYFNLAQNGIGFGRGSFGDIDNDGDLDCLFGDSHPGRFFLYTNTGNASLPEWVFHGELNNATGVEGGVSYATPILVDLNNDNYPEIVSGHSEGGINLWWNKTVETTIKDQYSDGSVKQFSLHQNYPNPFNPTTNIRYSIPVAEKVSIKVFDMLGKEVAVLVNEHKNAGVYSIEFDGSHLSSGVYFYKIKAGSFLEMKKMLLVR